MQNPAVAGFHPDPSICRDGDDYWLACSSFEYFPGVPIFHSRDAEHWTPAGHVATRPGQLALEHVPTGGGVWAPTIRCHDGRFWLIVADAMGRGPLLFTADDPRGPWSDGIPVTGADGIDHDLAWDDAGNLYVTFSGLLLDGEAMGTHLGICQVRLDSETGRALEPLRRLWSGTGLKFPEAPHLYAIGNWWYLMIAEGGTERGHGVSIARGQRPDGPFEGHPRNPIYSHKGTNHPVQNTGHADLVETADGWMMVMLGTRPTGLTQAFAALGRETFATRVTWADGWPVVEPMPAAPAAPPLSVATDFALPLGHEWLSVRDAERAWLAQESGALVIEADSSAPAVAMDAFRPRFLGRRQEHTATRMAATVESGEGTGGISVRYDELHHYDIEAGAGVVRARVRLDQVSQEWTAPAPAGAVTLWIETVPATAGQIGLAGMTCDNVHLGFDGADGRVEVAVMDGRYLTSDTCASFTGRVTGMYAVTGRVAFRDFTYDGRDA